MPYDEPLLTDQVDVAIATKTAGGLKALRDGSANHYAGTTGNKVGALANAIVLTTDTASPVHQAYVDGHVISIRPRGTNTAGVTIELDGLVAKAALKRVAGVMIALVPGDIILNIDTRFMFSSQSDGWILEVNPNLALTNTQNTYIKAQIIKVASSMGLLIDADGGGNGASLKLLGNGAITPSKYLRSRSGNLEVVDDAFVSIIMSWDDTGKQIKGTVPLARLEGGTEIVVSRAFTNVVPHSSSGTAIPYPGAQLGDIVLLSWGTDNPNFIYRAGVDVAGQVRLRAFNITDTIQSSVSTNFKIKVLK